MEYRNIFLVNPARLSVQREQLVIEQAEKFTVPLEDISAVLIESQQVQLTVHAAAALAEHGVTVFLCDEKHLPCAQILPINQYCRQRKMLTAQCEMGKPLKKQLWQRIVVQKIRNQAACAFPARMAGRSCDSWRKRFSLTTVITAKRSQLPSTSHGSSARGFPAVMMTHEVPR